MTHPLVSVIIVNYNGGEFLRRALASLCAQTYPEDRLEIIVIDNASSDDSLARARSDFPDFLYLENERNLGFAAGANLGYRRAQGDLIAFLNNDAVAEPGWCEALVSAFSEDDRVGLATSRILLEQRTLDLEIESSTFWPCEVLPSTDTRELGVRLLGVDTVGVENVAVSYGEGFYPEENGTPERYRWTDGHGRVRITFAGDLDRLPIAIRVDGWRPATVPPSRLVLSALGKRRIERELARETREFVIELGKADLDGIPRRIQNAGLAVYRDWFAGDRGFGCSADSYPVREEVFGACGAAMMVSRSLVSECGLFDPSFFMYYEDVDLAYRARFRGYRCLYVPEAVVLHRHAGSSVEGSPFFVYNVDRNRLAVMVKHAPLRTAARAIRRYTAEACRHSYREIRRGVFRGGPHSAGGTGRLKLKVVGSLAARMPRLLGQRVRIQSLRAVGRSEVESWFRPRVGPGSRVKVGVYDLHLRTLGGGEKYLAEMASVLSDSYDVDLIAYRPPARELIERRLHVDLSKVRIRSLPGDRERDMRPLSAGYDLFINGTHDSELEAYSDRSILVCHFPKRRNRQSLAAVCRRFVLGPPYEYLRGFYDPEMMEGRPHVWTNGCGVLRIRNLVGSLGLVIDLHIIEYRAEGVDVRFAVEGQPVPCCEINVLPGGVTQYKIRVEPGMVEPGRQYFCLSIVSTIFRPAQNGTGDTRDLGVIVRHVGLARPGGGRVHSARWRLGYLAGGLLDDVSSRFPHVATYDVVLTHSRYSSGWIEKWWGRTPELIYPAIYGLEQREKRNIILSVGRFFEGHHNKKHLLLVLAFKALCNQGLSGWELHMVGGTHEEEQHRRYLERVRREARGYPVAIHTNIPYGELADFYGKAKIFWHASGHEEDERRHPERFEHFGISTVEAMLAGAVPVVIGKAGQLETVTDGVDGFLWQDLRTLKEKTRLLAGDAEVWERMSGAARKRAQDFSIEVFRERVGRLLGGLLA